MELSNLQNCHPSKNAVARAPIKLGKGKDAFATDGMLSTEFKPTVMPNMNCHV